MDNKPDTAFQPRDPDFESRVRESFARQTAMKTLGIALHSVTPGAVEMSFAYDKKFIQQRGFIHAGIITAGLDSACGYAALSLTEKGVDVLTVEFKTSLLAPARHAKIIFRGHVIKPGRNITFAESAAYGIDGDDGAERMIARMSGTLFFFSDDR